MGLIGSDSNDNDSKRIGVDEEIDWEYLVSGGEDVLFSCSNEDSGKERELFVTETRVFIRVGSRGGSFPIEKSVIDFGERNGMFRITFSDGDFGYGIRVGKDDFREFWRVFTSLLEN